MAYTHGYDPDENARIEAEDAPGAIPAPSRGHDQTELLRLILTELRAINRRQQMNDALGRTRLGALRVEREWTQGGGGNHFGGLMTASRVRV